MDRFDFRRAYVPGTFDLFHYGHERLLRRAATLADEVVVSVNDDAFCARFKRRPAQPLRKRMEVLRECPHVTFVVVNAGGEDSKQAIDVVAPDLILHGDDWTGDAYLDQLGVDRRWLSDRGISLVHPPYTHGVSTTQLLEEGAHG